MKTQTELWECLCNMCSKRIQFESERTGENVECPHCGFTTFLYFHPKPQPAPQRRPPFIPGNIEGVDPAFFDRGGVLVTRSRFVVGSQFFAVANISSARVIYIPPDRTAPCLAILGALVLFVVGGGFASVEEGSKALGYVLLSGAFGALTLAIVWLTRLRASYGLLVTAAGGERSAITHHDNFFLGEVLSALNAAIIAQGL
jgi:DNA-directed RNA polymerase subunit RPC12/RpoP